jgi:transposase
MKKLIKEQLRRNLQEKAKKELEQKLNSDFIWKLRFKFKEGFLIDKLCVKLMIKFCKNLEDDLKKIFLDNP